MRFFFSLALAFSMMATAEAGGCFGKKTSRCCSAPCDSGCGVAANHACGSGCEANGTWETVQKTVLVPEMVTE